MKHIMNALSNIWAMLGLAFIASVVALVLMWAVDGVTVLRPWLWIFLAAVSILAVILSLALKNPRVLVLIPLFAFPTFLAGGLSANLGVVQSGGVANEAPMPEGNGPKKVSDVANGLLSKFFGQ